MQEMTINALVSPEGSLEILSNHEVNRLKDRSESVDPKCAKSSTAKLDPRRDIPYTAMEEPRRQ